MLASIIPLFWIFLILDYFLWGPIFFRPEEYKKKVSEYVKKYATEDALRDPSQVSWEPP